MPHLYGYQDLLTSFVPSLVGLKPDGPGRPKRPYEQGAPVVRLVGGPGSGRTAPLQELFARYNGRLPVVYADVARLNTLLWGGDSGGDGTAATGAASGIGPEPSPLPGVLHVLARDLMVDVGHRAPLRFPRLQTGLLLTVSWRPVPSPRLEAAENDLRELLEAGAPGQGRFQDSLRAWLDLLPEVLSQIFPGVPYLSTVAKAALSSVPNLPALPGRSRKAVEWWGWQLRGFPGSDLQRLVRFLLDLAGPEADLDFADELLLRAFLADIDAHYTPLRRWDRTPLPLVLLDNTHTETGRRVLGTLLTAYGPDFAGPGHEATRPVVVASALGGTDGLTGARDVRRAANRWHRQSTRSAAGDPQDEAVRRSRVLDLAVPLLDATDITGMFPTAARPGPGVPGAIERLTAGRAGSVRILVEAARTRLRAGRPPAAGELLDLPEPEEGRPATAERLAEHLVPDPSVRAGLPLLAAALDEGTAELLRAEFHGPLHAREHVRQARAFLRQAHWQHGPRWPGFGPGTPFVDDPALRAIFLRLLAASPHDWAEVHLRARSAYCPDRSDPGPYAPGHGVAYLHHTLALGQIHPVVHALHARYEERRPAAWLADVQVVCAAPRPPADVAPPPAHDAAGPPPSCGACDDPLLKPLHTVVADLVRLLWKLSAPTARPLRTELEDLTYGLRRLHELEDGGSVYHRASQVWPDRLRQGARVPALPVPDEEEDA